MYIFIDSVDVDIEELINDKSAELLVSTPQKPTSLPGSSADSFQEYSKVKLPTAETGAVPKRPKMIEIPNPNNKVGLEVSKQQILSSDSASGKGFILTHLPNNIRINWVLCWGQVLD